MNPIQYLQDKTNFALHVTNALGYSFPPPFLLGRSVVRADESNYEISNFDNEYRSSFENIALIVPMKLHHPDDADSDWFELPTDPLVSISCKNIITRRYVAKQELRGSIKESWSLDDYEITIAGLLMHEREDVLESYMTKMRRYCESREAIGIQCGILLKVFGIKKMAVESFEFPFTSGQGNQAFTIKGYSDEGYQLLLDAT